LASTEGQRTPWEKHEAWLNPNAVFQVGYLERLPLRMPYAAVVTRSCSRSIAPAWTLRSRTSLN